MNNSTDHFFHKRIKLLPQSLEVAKAIEAKHAVSPVIAKILAARNFACDQNLADYLNPTLQNSLPNPENLKNLTAAGKLIYETVAQNQTIAICCDFDVDGLTGASQVKSFFDQLKITCEVYVPDRFKEGYGLNEKMIQEANAAGHTLLICIDYGTTNIKELELARLLGIKTIVVDHHHTSQNPPADVFVNPEQEGCGFAGKILCSAGLAWYLLIILKKQLLALKPEVKDIDLREYLDLACLGTICDMVPLVGVNRVIAQKGLEQLSSSKRVGIQALKKVIGIKGPVQGHHVGFGFGPRINAAGRMMSGQVVIKLLTTTNEAEAQKIATRLDKLNQDRQEVESKIKERAKQLINRTSSIPFGLTVWGDNYHTGVIGIVAQRLSESFYRPAIVMGKDQGKLKGSVRGIPGFSVVAALSELSPFFDKFGGHDGAGGFTLKTNNPEELATAFNEVCQKNLANIELVPSVKADTVIELSELDLKLCEDLKTLAPFGMGNPGAQIMIQNLYVRDLTLLKNNHLKITVTDGKKYLTGFLWQTARHPALFPGAKVDIACKPEVNEFNGNLSVQLNIQACQASTVSN